MNFGSGELLLIAGVALLIFGPSQLPRLFKGLGESFRQMKLAAKELVPDETPQPQKDEPKRDQAKSASGGSKK